MSLNPPSKPSSFERLRWKFPRELDGLVLDSFEELKKIFPMDEEHDEVYLRSKNRNYKERFDRYSRNYQDRHSGFDVAYGCPECEKIIIGSPRIEDEDSIGIMDLTGRKGYDLYCKNCHVHLGEHTTELS